MVVVTIGAAEETAEAGVVVVTAVMGVIVVDGAEAATEAVMEVMGEVVMEVIGEAVMEVVIEAQLGYDGHTK